MRALSIVLLIACGAEPVREHHDTPREIPHVPEAARPAIEAAQAQAGMAEVGTSAMWSPEDRLAAERAALDQVGMAAQLPPPPGRVHLMAPTEVQGRFNANSLRAVMNPKLEELESCYTGVLREDRHAMGRVVARWTLSRGRVTEVEIVPGTINEAVNDCLVEWLRELRVRSAGTVVFTQPFLFHHAS